MAFLACPGVVAPTISKCVVAQLFYFSQFRSLMIHGLAKEQMIHNLASLCDRAMDLSQTVPVANSKKVLL